MQFHLHTVYTEQKRWYFYIIIILYLIYKNYVLDSLPSIESSGVVNIFQTLSKLFIQ
jgi:hypothetical protein